MRIEEHPILTYDRSKKIKFYYEDKELFGYAGETIAAALHANGIKELKHDQRPRGFFCGIGNCSSCLMEVNGIPNLRVCVEPLQENMVVRKQVGKGSMQGGAE